MKIDGDVIPAPSAIEDVELDGNEVAVMIEAAYPNEETLEEDEG
jgi:hypothetical protein